MSGEFIYSPASPGEKDLVPRDDVFEVSVQEGTEFETGERQKAAGLEKGIKVLIIAAASVLVLELLWIFAISPCMPLSRLEISGFSGLGREEILRRAGIGERASYISINPRSVEKNLEAIREVESVRVTKRFPNSVTILMVPRTAVAMAFDKIEGRRTPLYFDRHGVLFKAGSSPAEVQAPGHLVLPVISGLPLGEDRVLPAIYLPLFTSLERIRSAEPRLLQVISEIRVNRKPFDGFDLILYPVHSPIRVRLEPNLNEETLRYVMLMLDVFAEKEQEIEEIDFRTETASYKLKEASSD
ncbi:MAG: FtsQ-type POTRA domain-containing protein [Treponema sp.]|jgi:cell division protein FtsQ|nr:FtsQ-type POTRA domain-containing protein [Treponema sp.]